MLRTASRSWSRCSESCSPTPSAEARTATAFLLAQTAAGPLLRGRGAKRPKQSPVPRMCGLATHNALHMEHNTSVDAATRPVRFSMLPVSRTSRSRSTAYEGKGRRWAAYAVGPVVTVRRNRAEHDWSCGALDVDRAAAAAGFCAGSAAWVGRARCPCASLSASSAARTCPSCPRAPAGATRLS